MRDPLAASPGRVCAFVVGVTLIGLGLDRAVALPGQYVLGLLCWGMLGLALRSATRTERVQTLVVIVVATCFEVIGSIIWGAYLYRHHNLPMFVPPGHGLVYLFGLRLSQTAWVRTHARLWVGIAATGLAAWAVLGLTVLPRADVGGVIGCIVLLAFLLRGRNATVYASVFAFVAFLEIYGVSMGTWAWQAHIPGTPDPDRQPAVGHRGRIRVLRHRRDRGVAVDTRPVGALAWARPHGGARDGGRARRRRTGHRGPAGRRDTRRGDLALGAQHHEVVLAGRVVIGVTDAGQGDLGRPLRRGVAVLSRPVR